MSSRFSKVKGRDRASDGELASDGAPRTSRAGESRVETPVSAVSTAPLTGAAEQHASVDLARRRDELTRRFAELQYDLGGILYEMAIRDHIRVEVLVRHAAALQDVDAELHEVERL
jgi:hypothetical protein